ncbi:MAG: hypothetical protein IKU57_02660 [Oscillospiraceae bacterium]|nr:hypothetical protein [Oscillospiraceae bacterium]
MQKKKIGKLLYILAALWVLIGCVLLCVDYSRYNSTLNSAPFSVWILARVIEFGLPAVIVSLVAFFLGRKDK